MKKILILMLICLSATIGGYSQKAVSPNQRNAIINKINKVALSMKSMTCDFTQTKYLSILNDKMVSTGKMYYQQPNSLRWEYVSPYQYTFILNGNKVLLKSKNKKDVINVQSNKIFKEIARIMINSVTGRCLSDSSDFKVEITESSSEWVANLTPLKKEMLQMFSKIKLHFSISKMMVTKVEMIEKSGDKTSIELKNPQINKPINATYFSIN